jgi:hypothetical protein
LVDKVAYGNQFLVACQLTVFLLQVQLKIRGVGRSESGNLMPHSKTLSRLRSRPTFRKVLECGIRLPLFPSKISTTMIVNCTFKKSGGHSPAAL